MRQLGGPAWGRFRGVQPWKDRIIGALSQVGHNGEKLVFRLTLSMNRPHDALHRSLAQALWAAHPCAR